MDYSRLIVLLAVVLGMAAIAFAAMYLQRRREEKDMQSDRRMSDRRSRANDRRYEMDRRGPERRRHDSAHNLERRDGERRLGERRDTPDWVDQYRQLRRNMETNPTHPTDKPEP